MSLTLKKRFFMSRIVLSDPKLTSAVNFNYFEAEENFFVSTFLDVSMRKEQEEPLGRLMLLKVCHKVWVSYDKRFLNGSCESCHPGL